MADWECCERLSLKLHFYAIKISLGVDFINKFKALVLPDTTMRLYTIILDTYRQLRLGYENVIYQ